MSNNATPTGLSRRELWVDARDIQSGEGEGALSPEEYAQALETRGREKLAECQLVQSFTAQAGGQDNSQRPAACSNGGGHSYRR